MIIDRVIMKNFRSHEESNLLFSNGMNAIVGAGGSGKTSVIEAIGWLVFGHVGRHKISCLRHGAAYGYAECISGKLHVKKDILSTMEGTLRSDGRLIASGDRDVNLALQKVMGSDTLSGIFSSLIGITQAQFDVIFTYPKATRVKVFSDLMGVSSFKECSKWLVKPRNILSAKSGAKSTEMARMIGRAEALTEGDDLAHLIRSKGEIEKRLRQGASQGVHKLRYLQIARELISIRSEDSTTCGTCGQPLLGDALLEARNKIVQLEKELAKLEYAKDFSPQDYEAEKSELSKIEARVDLLERNEVSAGQANSVIESLGEEIEVIDQCISDLDKIRKGFSMVHEVMTGDIISMVSVMATRLAREIYPDWIIRWDDDFSLHVGEKEFINHLSKSQRAVCSIAIIMAMAKVVSPVDFITLDEPTANMDEYQSKALIEAIRESGWFKQVIIATNDSRSLSMFDNVVEV